MNCSEAYEDVCKYLGYYGTIDPATEARLKWGFDETERYSRFRAVGKRYKIPFPFLTKEPYRSFLQGCEEYAFVAMTLGTEIEQRIRYLMKTVPADGVVLDACASVIAEQKADEWEERFGENRTFRFCPGYGGSDVKDVAEIFKILRPETIGIQLLESGLMVPQKSMAGIVGIGKKIRKSCGDCERKPNCGFLREGTTCFHSEKN